MAEIANIKKRPPLKWAGGKYNLIERIAKYLPNGGRLVEPFVGSGAVFLNLEYDEYYLNDINKDLINLYKTIQANGKDFIGYANSFFTPKYHTENSFYELRERFNNSDDITEKSAILIYINKFGFNGLMRYNASGGMNVPFGHHKKMPYFPEKELIHFFNKSKKAVFRCMDFQKVISRAKADDVIYCDPPYVPVSKTANFTAYSAGGFSELEQVSLSKLAEEMKSKGIPIVISNHYTPITKKLYKAARKYKFPVQRMISCNGEKREKAMEILAVYK